MNYALGFSTQHSDEEMLIFVRDLVVPFSIGLREREKLAKQKVRINVGLVTTLAIPEADDPAAEHLSYSDLVRAIRALSEAGHIHFVETLAERIAALCLEDSRVCRAHVTVEKLDVYDDAGGVGVSIVKTRSPKR